MKEVDPTDEALVRRAKGGDELAFAELYRRFHGRIFRFALHMSGSGSVAEDILQEVFLLFLRKIDSFDASRANLSSYLYGIARNMVLRWLQQHRQELSQEASMDDQTAESVSAVARTNPLAEVTRQELIDGLRRAILTLPSSYREVIVLCELQELSYGEAASVMGCAVGTVRSRLHRARTLLLQKLQSMAEGPSEKAAGGMTYELSTF